MTIKNVKIIKSPLNYIGGKAKILDQILPLFPKDINNLGNVRIALIQEI